MTGWRKLTVLVSTAALVAGLGAVHAGRTPAATGQKFEMNVSSDPSSDNAEPSVAVNPLDPNNIVVLYIREPFLGKHDLVHKQIPTTNDLKLQSVNVAVTHDGGRTWTRRMMPTIDPTRDPIMSNSSDPYVLFGPDGSAYAMTTGFNPAFPLWDDIRVAVSHDGGDTWGDPVIAFGNTLNPGSHPLDDVQRGRVRQYGDRPWFAIDNSTGTLYLTGVQTWVQPSGTEGELGYLVSSVDGGRTWTSPVEAAPVGSPIPSAAFGTLALVYNPPSSPLAPAECTCVILALSHDRGQSFTRLHTPATGSEPEVAADPSHPGRFAIEALTNGDKDVSVWVTPDAGQTWSGPTVVSESPATTRTKAWMSYSRNGVLGTGWRTVYGDGSYDFWAAASPGGDTAFDPPVRLSTVTSPPVEQPYVAGDDTSDLQFGPNDTLYGGWADWRTGTGEEVFVGGFPVR